MICPKCGANTKVMDSRCDKNTVHRRRKCTLCGQIFYTAETIAESGDVFKKVYRNYKNRRRYYEG